MDELDFSLHGTDTGSTCTLGWMPVHLSQGEGLRELASLFIVNDDDRILHSL